MATESRIFALDARMLPRTHGGVAHATMGLIRVLGELDGPETYQLVVESDEQFEWLRPHKGPNQVIIDRRPWMEKNLGAFRPSKTGKITKALLRPVAKVLKSIHNRLHTEPPAWPQLELSDGFFESLGCDVLHQPSQRYIVVALPTIYMPHDLQQLHYPQFFTPYELARREVVYPAGCHFAQTVIAGTQWIKDDIAKQYSINPEKIQIIPWASPTLAYTEPTPAELLSVREKYKLEPPFAFYPAAAWPHKNHLRLIEAIAHLRDTKGIQIRLVCTGSIANDFYIYHWPKIEKRLHELKLEGQVKFLGFLPESDMRAMYRLAQFLVLPSLFEADSCPIHEAWVEGLPVTCSNSSALPDQVHDAALMFDPKNVEDIARALAKVATRVDVREQLIERGTRRVKDFDWGRTAAAYRAVYRRTAGDLLSEEDRWLLNWDWMREPNRQLPEFVKV